jgi:O-antigen/teichoic acid export membrane protein
MLKVKPSNHFLRRAGDYLSRFSHSLKWVKKGSLAVIDQGLISGSNFLVAILLARWLVPEQYGAFALAFEGFVLFYVVYNALILEPMSVFGPSEYQNRLQEYWGVLLWIQLGIAIISVFLLGCCALVLHEFGSSNTLAQALLGAMVAIPCVQFFYVARGAMYVKLTPRPAVIASVLYSAVVLSGLMLVYVLKLISPFAAFLSMAVGGLLAGSALLIQFKPRLKLTSGFPKMGDVVRQHWVYGRWALAGSALITLSGSVYYPLLGKFRGLTETGALKAVLNFSSPIGQLFVAFTLLLLPFAARRYHDQGAAGVERLIWKFTWLYSGGAAVYWFCFLIFWPSIVRFLYAGKYIEVASLVPLVALSSIARIAASVQTTALRAIQLPSLVFVAFCGSSVVGLAVGIPTVWAFGLRGAVFATAFSNTATLVFASILVHRNSNQLTDRPTLPSYTLENSTLP